LKGTVMLRFLCRLLWMLIYPILKRLEPPIQRWVEPTNQSLVLGTVADLTRDRAELVLENAFLRQQVIVLGREKKRPALTNQDRRLLVLLARWLPSWKAALLIVQPDTLIRWHRELFKVVWRRKSKANPKPHAATLSLPTIRLIWQLAADNRLWGAEWIRGELLKLGIQVSKRIIQKYLKQMPELRPTGHTWSTFVRNHAADIWACDFVQTYDVFFRAIFVFVIIELESRQVVHVNVTRSPSDAWVAQQLREATPFGQAPQYLIRDNDRKYGEHFANVAAEIEILRTPVRAPRANAYCERFIGSLRRECLDHILILSEKQLRCLVNKYVQYFNGDRPHQGIDQRIPAEPDTSQPAVGEIVARPVLGGLYHAYSRRAA
jgi:putative transposase